MTVNQYLCEHDREGMEMISRDDPMLPPEYEWRECPECGTAAEWDKELDQSAHA